MVPVVTSNRSVTVTIDLDALRANALLAQQLSGASKLFATVKADAYGHGAIAVARALAGLSPFGQHADAALVDGFAVVTVAEALELRSAGIDLPILVMQGPQAPHELPDLATHGLWPALHTREQLQWFRIDPARSEIRCWLKVDTGMGRLGFFPEDVSAIVNADDGIQWHGVLSHFSSADEPGSAQTAAQIECFRALDLPPHLERSVANSAGVLGWQASQHDWARVGLMLYGVDPFRRATAGLHAVMQVEAPLISVKHLRRGSGIGYGQSFTCPEAMSVGYVAIGYGDGLPRRLSDRALVRIDGIDCPVIGRVSMDSIMVDLRVSPQASVGTKVEIWGRSAPIDRLALAADTISYELMCNIRGRRLYEISRTDHTDNGFATRNRVRVP